MTQQILFDKLLDLFVNFVGFLLSGGILVFIIEWRRHKREQREWKREDAKLEIDVPRTDISTDLWAIVPSMTDKEKLQLYEKQLLGSVKSYTVLIDFVVRNTTRGQLVVTSYGVEGDPPVGTRRFRLHDMETGSPIDPEAITATTLQPLGTLARTALVVRDLYFSQRLDRPPSRMTVYAVTSDGSRVQKEVDLRASSDLPTSHTPWGSVHLSKYLDKLSPEEWERLRTEEENIIPF